MNIIKSTVYAVIVAFLVYVVVASVASFITFSNEFDIGDWDNMGRLVLLFFCFGGWCAGWTEGEK
jgi:hypothetical protein